MGRLHPQEFSPKYAAVLDGVGGPLSVAQFTAQTGHDPRTIAR